MKMTLILIILDKIPATNATKVQGTDFKSMNRLYLEKQ